MSKIYAALEKFRKERAGKVLDRLRNSDYDFLLRFDEQTGRLETDDPLTIANSDSLNRLMTHRLIDAGGRMTPAGRAKYEELRREYKERQPQSPVASSRAKQQAQQATRADKLSASDWAILMQYDRKSGNLLTYDPGAGRLHRNSKAILKDPALIQRLIDADMILPGGALTPRAKRECARIEQKLKRKKRKGSLNREANVLPDRAARPSETLSRADLNVLLQSDPKTHKLDLNNPAIANDPGIVRRLVANKIISPDGRLTPRGVLNWQILSREPRAGDEKAPAERRRKQSIAEKMPKNAHKTQPASSFAESEQKKLRIIHFEEDEQGAEEKAQEARAGTPAPAYKSPHGAPKPDKSPPKDDLQIPGRAAAAAGPHGAPVGGRFSLGKTAVRFDKKAVNPDLITLLDPQSFEAEQFKILRTNLLYSDSGKIPRSVLVTSAVPGEGKSFVAANLAISAARHVNWNVLLIDCDLRRPSVHRQFGFKEVPGLSDYLLRGALLESLLLKTCVDNLTILPGGRPPDNPSEILSSDRMSTLLDEVATRYNDRLIILDSPPPTIAAETGALARLVDGIILVVKYGSTSRKIVRDLVDRLGRDKLIGAILNFDTRSLTYPGYYYRYY